MSEVTLHTLEGISGNHQGPLITPPKKSSLQRASYREMTNNMRIIHNMVDEIIPAQ